MVKKLFSQGCGNPMKGCNKKRWCQQDHQATPLSKKSTCGPARICGVRGDRKHCARLAALGVYPGNEIELISPSNGRECIVKVPGGTISFDGKLIRKDGMFVPEELQGLNPENLK